MGVRATDGFIVYCGHSLLTNSSMILLDRGQNMTVNKRLFFYSIREKNIYSFSISEIQ
jgi:hypothetical protein